MNFRFALMIVSAALLLSPMATAPAQACGADSDCLLGERTYRIRQPENRGDKPVGAVIFAHGYRGTAEGIMRNKNLGAMVSGLGLALVAPKSLRGDWDIPDAPSEVAGSAKPGEAGYSELAYFDALKEDLTQNHGIDGRRILITGFSAGGMMTWNLACDRGSAFAAFAPISGTFWGKLASDKTCPDMARFITHLHGTSDGVVPIKGRPIGSTVQGDVNIALDIARRINGYAAPEKGDFIAGLSCTQSKSEDTGKEGFVQYCLHPGGHTFQSIWLKNAWQQFERSGAFGPSVSN